MAFKKKVLLITLLHIFFIGAIANAQSTYKTISKDELYSKIYASWLGQLVGNIYGLPHENAYIDDPGPSDFPYGYGPNIEMLEKYNGAFSDDDTDIEYIYLHQMQDHGIEPTYGQLAQAWKYHIRNRVWLANRAALSAMHFGIKPPATGSKKFNPHWFQIDPQLVNEIWGVTAPGMVKYASDKSAWAARITNDGWGIEPTIHYGAMYAAAFFEDDVKKVIDIGTRALPDDSRFAETVKQMEELYRKYPDDWQKARQEMAKQYYYNEPSITKTIWNANLNGAAGILALLYGEGDFQKTLDLACALGFDADNQAATMSGLLAIMKGKDAIPKNLLYPLGLKEWDKPFNDRYINVTRYDMPDGKITNMAEVTTELAIKNILRNGGSKTVHDNEEIFEINTGSVFQPPLEFYKDPKPILSVGEKVEYEFNTSIPSNQLSWEILSGELPPGLDMVNGKIIGKPEKTGLYPVTFSTSNEGKSLTKTFQLYVNGSNLALEASEIISNVEETDTTSRNEMWLTFGKDLYANNVSVINDNRIWGNNTVFYSINGYLGPKEDYYGYKWDNQQQIKKLVLHIGSMEESSGWFENLNVEYINKEGNWEKVNDVRMHPNLMPGTKQFNKPNFVTYVLKFPTISTNGIRIIGQAGNTEHWQNKPIHFTSITELQVYAN